MVQADNVTVHDLTVDGTNTALDPGNGVSRGGVLVHARGGIVTDGSNASRAYTNFTVHHCDVKNIYLRGIFAASQGPSHTLDFHDNAVDNVQGDDCAIGIFSRFGSGTLTNNTATRCLDAISSNWSQGLIFSGNVVSVPGTGYETVGLHTDNAGWSGTADTLAGNQVTGYDRGIFVFYPHQGVTVTGNSSPAAASGSHCTAAPLRGPPPPSREIPSRVRERAPLGAPASSSLPSSPASAPPTPRRRSAGTRSIRPSLAWTSGPSP